MSGVEKKTLVGVKCCCGKVWLGVEKVTPYPEGGESPRKLPTFEGYTVDERLREFRRTEYGKRIEFVPFDSPKGRKLLERMRSNMERMAPR